MTQLLLTSEQIGQLVAQFFIAGAGTLSFAILFACPKRTLPYCGLVGAVGWFVYETAILFGLEAFAASLLADRKSTRLNSSHMPKPRMPSSA